ncbi:PTS lactose/cellobiose transporter subunit IIA [Enorma massiliensis]|uniref:PTS lactose/cellobiose transporter subunit IIA n=3 Tax=Coriobacteriaceae TaxID=84107 RepID=A0A1Y3U006_9ACTN|nr:PTS lactose/cellobiose transporter subunit IIA [Enorma massiliensis]MRX79457.1 PTS lactose/cellobiose transporter subunit IIA [Enorma shizhengliae]OUN42164.1 PTS lactose/cellobiose transporter subunit IIA [Enorma massiliensis]
MEAQQVGGQDVELIPFALIADAGEAKSLAFMALNEAKQGNFEACDDYMKQSDEAYLRAHNTQTEILVKEANGEHMPVNVMLVHAQDHLMTSNLARELIRELIELYRVRNA